MNLILPLILGIYIMLFTIRYFVVNELNSKKLLPNKLKENSIAFIKMKEVLHKDRRAQSLYKRYTPPAHRDLSKAGSGWSGFAILT